MTRGTAYIRSAEVLQLAMQTPSAVLVFGCLGLAPMAAAVMPAANGARHGDTMMWPEVVGDATSQLIAWRDAGSGLPPCPRGNLTTD